MTVPAPLLLPLFRGCTWTPPPFFLSTLVQKPSHAPCPISFPHAGLATPEHPTLFPHSSAAKCHFSVSGSSVPHRKLPRSSCHPLSSVSSAARPPLAKMALTSSCSFSHWSPGTHPHNRWPPEGIIAVGKPPCCRCSATSTVPRHLGEPHRPSPCMTHAPWSPLACADHLLPPRPPARRHHPRRSRGDRALRGCRAPRSQPARPASGPCAQPVAKAACRARRTASPRGRGLGPD
jgi:hypothetical protein